MMIHTRLIQACLGTQLRRNAVAGVAGSVVNVAIAAVSYPLYLKFLGYDTYGVWLALAVILGIAQFGNLGLAPAVAKKVAEHHARGEFDALREYVSTAIFTMTLAGLVFSGVILCFGHSLIALMRLTPELSKLANGMLPFVALLSIYVLQIETLNAVLSGLGRFDLAIATQVSSRVLALAVSATLLACSFGLSSLPVASLAGYTYLHVVSHILIRRVAGNSCISLRSFDRARLRVLLGFGGAIGGCSLMNLLVGPFNKFMLARYTGPASIPIYELAYTIGMQLRGILESGFRSLMPEISRLASIGSPEHIARVHSIQRRALLLIVRFGAPLFLCALVFAPPVLKLWLGARFRPEIAPAARILMVGAFLSLSGAPAYYFLVGIGRLRHLVYGNILQSLVNSVPLVVLVCLGVSFSARMAAAATATGMACGAFYLFMAARRVKLCA